MMTNCGAAGFSRLILSHLWSGQAWKENHIHLVFAGQMQDIVIHHDKLKNQLYMFFLNTDTSSYFPICNTFIAHGLIKLPPSSPVSPSLYKYAQAMWENVICNRMNYGPSFNLYTLCFVKPGALRGGGGSCFISQNKTLA